MQINLEPKPDVTKSCWEETDHDEIKQIELQPTPFEKKTVIVSRT